MLCPVHGQRFHSVQPQGIPTSLSLDTFDLAEWIHASQLDSSRKLGLPVQKRSHRSKLTSLVRVFGASLSP